MFWDSTVEYLQAMTKLAKEGEGDYMKANLLSKDFWFVAKELTNQEGFDEVLALVNKDLLDIQHAGVRSISGNRWHNHKG